MKRAICTLMLCAASLGAQGVVVPGGGIVSQVVDGSGWKTSITIVNLDNTIALFDMGFFADDGSPMSLTTNFGTASLFSGSIPPRGTLTLSTAGLKSSLSQGYGILGTTSTLGGTVVFQSTGNHPLYEASEPIDGSIRSRWVMPFDHTNGNATGGAIVNVNLTPAVISIAFRDENGSILLTDSFPLAPLQHMTAVLTQSYPSTIGLRGTVEVYTNLPAVSVLGLHFGPSGVFNSIAPLAGGVY